MSKWEKRSASEWVAIFTSQKESGRTAAAYCRDNGINYKQFLYIRKRTNQSERQSLAISDSAEVSASVHNRRFTRIRVERGSAMRIRFPRGMVVESDGILPASWVTEAAERWLRMGE